MPPSTGACTSHCVDHAQHRQASAQATGPLRQPRTAAKDHFRSSSSPLTHRLRHSRVSPVSEGPVGKPRWLPADWAQPGECTAAWPSCAAGSRPVPACLQAPPHLACSPCRPALLHMRQQAQTRQDTVEMQIGRCIAGSSRSKIHAALQLASRLLQQLRECILAALFTSPGQAYWISMSMLHACTRAPTCAGLQLPGSVAQQLPEPLLMRGAAAAGLRELRVQQPDQAPLLRHLALRQRLAVPLDALQLLLQVLPDLRHRQHLLQGRRESLRPSENPSVMCNRILKQPCTRMAGHLLQGNRGSLRAVQQNAQDSHASALQRTMIIMQRQFGHLLSDTDWHTSASANTGATSSASHSV